MDQIWLASPCPALRLWPGGAGPATWRLNPSALAWGRRRQLTETSWRAIAAELSRTLTGGPEREGQLAEPALRWRSLPMNTGWLVWLMPDEQAAAAHPLLQASAAELLELVRTFGNVGLFECDLGTGVMRWDRHHFTLFDFDIAQGEPSAPEVLARVHPDDRCRVESEFKRFAATLGRHAIGYSLRLADGSERVMQSWLEVRPDDAGRPARLLGIVVDHTENAVRIRAQEALSEQWADALRLAEASVWRVDLETGASEWSPQMFLLHGLSSDSPVPAFGAYLEAFVHPGDRAALADGWQAAIDAGRPRFDAECRIVRADGSLRNVEYRARRREDRSGRDIMVGVALDATDRFAQRAAAERTLREKSALERATAARSEFLARMSHELRTPLNAVLGFAQLIEHDGTSVPATVQLDRVVRIREAGEQLLRLVGDVLEHLRRESSVDDAVPTSPSPLDDDVAGGAEASAALSVLYIEDNPVNVILVEELVGMRPNTSLRCAVTGLDGVAMAAAATPHVVLVDMHLPDIDGFEVLRRLRTERALDRTAVIALSANGMGDDIALALAAGFDDYWTKPIDFRHFLNGLDSLARAR